MCSCTIVVVKTTRTEQHYVCLYIPPGHKVPTVQQCPGGILQGDCRVPDEGRAAQQEGHWRLPGRGVSGSCRGGIKYHSVLCTVHV